MRQRTYLLITGMHSYGRASNGLVDINPRGGGWRTYCLSIFLKKLHENVKMDRWEVGGRGLISSAPIGFANDCLYLVYNYLRYMVEEDSPQMLRIRSIYTEINPAKPARWTFKANQRNQQTTITKQEKQL